MQRRGTRADGHGRLLVVYSARGFLVRIVCFEMNVRLLHSKVDNCNEDGSQLPHGAHISRASCLKKPAEPNDILVFSARVQNV